VEIIESRSINAFELLRDEWRDLVSRCAHVTIFQTWEWNEAWWRTFGKGKHLFLLQVREGNTLVGLAPLFISGKVGRSLGKLGFIGTGLTDYLDILVLEQQRAEVCSKILEYLFAFSGFSAVDLEDLQAVSPLREAAMHWTRTKSELRCVSLLEQNPGLSARLPPTWEEYSRRLDKVTRDNLSRRTKKLGRDFQQIETRLADPVELPQAMAALFELHQERWNARGLPGNFRNEKVQSFHCLVAKRFQEQGWLRLHVVRADGHIIATQYSFRFRDRYYCYLNGFSVKMSRYGLGTMLLAEAAQQAISEGCTEFDLLRGNEAYKQVWSPEQRTNYRILVTHPQQTLRSRATLLVDRAAKKWNRLRGWVRMTLSNFPFAMMLSLIGTSDYIN
jgi:CelD/BcsL family acetyltransferase involved in cellulose biosynthesis